ncbi:MAG: DMT family transporter [Hyphomicrobiaceae bacterium]|nr:DMT family transporter [Hyphomicrobiaceae bacterium]
MADQGSGAPPSEEPPSPAPDAAEEKAALQAAKNRTGMLLMALAMGAFSLNDTMTKATSAELPTGEILAIRGAFAVAMLAPIVIYRYGLRAIPRAYSRPLLIRNVAEIFGAWLFLSALFRLPLANVVSILQTLPLTMTAAAALLFREPVGWRRWTAASVGLLGVLLIVQPGSADFSWWYLAAIVSVVFITIRDVATKFIANTTPSLVITFVTAAVVMIAGILLGMTETWSVPSTGAVAKLAAAAVLVLVGYYTLIECWREAEISAVAPFRYTIVLWAMLLGYLVLGELPSLWTAIGSLIVVGAGLYTFHRERVRKTRDRS